MNMSIHPSRIIKYPPYFLAQAAYGFKVGQNPKIHLSNQVAVTLKLVRVKIGMDDADTWDDELSLCVATVLKFNIVMYDDLRLGSIAIAQSRENHGVILLFDPYTSSLSKEWGIWQAAQRSLIWRMRTIAEEYVVEYA